MTMSSTVSRSKLINRHPHVFGDVKADTSAEVKRNWEALEGGRRRRKAQAAERNAKATDAEERRAPCSPEFLPRCLRCWRPTS